MRRQKSSQAVVWERCTARRERMAWTPERDQRMPGCFTRMPETRRQEDSMMPEPRGYAEGGVVGVVHACLVGGEVLDGLADNAPDVLDPHAAKGCRNR